MARKDAWSWYKTDVMVPVLIANSPPLLCTLNEPQHVLGLLHLVHRQVLDVDAAAIAGILRSLLDKRKLRRVVSLSHLSHPL